MFPGLSLVAVVIIGFTFLMPLGVLEMVTPQPDGSMPAKNGALTVLGLLFAFVNTFVVIFFNAGLMACTYQALEGEEPSINHGFRIASRRAPQILGWTLVSVFVSAALSALESNSKVADIIASLLGMAWGAMTYFVLPIILVDGEHAFAAIKGSIETMKQAWGTALISNFSSALLGLALMLPDLAMIYAGRGQIVEFTITGSASLVLPFLGLTWMAASAIIMSAANTVLKSMLFDYATGVEMDPSIDTYDFQDAFRSKADAY